MDSSIVESKRFPGFSLVSTTDFFYPLVEDPRVQGQIACANVLSDMYAMGVTEIDTMLMILAWSTDMPAEFRERVTRSIIEGFDAHARLAGTSVSGGQSVQNPWTIIGGTAQSMCKTDEVMMPIHARVGDVLVLTKPLGTRCAVNAKQWMNTPEKWAKYGDILRREWVLYGYHKAVQQMARLNRTGAELMRKHNGRACTDVTGFGIIGHADNLASNQVNAVDFIIDTLPIIKYMRLVNDQCFDYKLMSGHSPETSGGLLIAMAQEDAQRFCEEIERIEGEPAWIVGRVVEGSGKGKLAENVGVIEV